MAECPPGVHSIFDPCPGDCADPVEDDLADHETLRIEWTTDVGVLLRWLYRHRANWEPISLTDPVWRWGIVQRDQERFAMEPDDTLCWDGIRVWLHSSRRQEVETCEAKEERMLKFGTGQITGVADDVEEKLLSKIGRSLTPAEWDALVHEDEDTEGE